MCVCIRFCVFLPAWTPFFFFAACQEFQEIVGNEEVEKMQAFVDHPATPSFRGGMRRDVRPVSIFFL